MKAWGDLDKGLQGLSRLDEEAGSTIGALDETFDKQQGLVTERVALAAVRGSHVLWQKSTSLSSCRLCAPFRSAGLLSNVPRTGLAPDVP
jgi:hypothetical protein